MRAARRHRPDLGTRATAWATNLQNHRLALGLVVLSIGVLLAAVAFKATSGPPFQAPYRIKVELPRDAPIVRKALAVRVGGKLAGLVGDVTLDPRTGRRIVTVNLTKPAFRRLPTDTQANIRVASLLYATFVELRPGTATSHLRDGDRLRAPATSGVDLLEVVRLFDASTRAAIRTTLRTSGIGVAGRGTELNEALATLPRLSRNLAGQLRAVTRTPGALERLVAGAARTTSGLRGRRRDDVAGLVDGGGAVLQVTARRRRQISATLEALPPLEHEILRTGPVAERLLDDLAAASGDLLPATRSLDATLPSLQRLFALGRTLRNEVTRILAAVDPVLRTARPIAYELFPIVTAFGPLERSLRQVDDAVGPYAPEITLAGKRALDAFVTSRGGNTPGSLAVRGTVSIAPRRCYNARPAPGQAEQDRCDR